MIANLITTILLALGVATGNVSSNSYKGGNAFNHVEERHEKPVQKQNSTTTDTATLTFNEVDTYTEVYYGSGHRVRQTKYEINGTPTNQTASYIINADAYATYDAIIYNGSNLNLMYLTVFIKLNTVTPITNSTNSLTFYVTFQEPIGNNKDYYLWVWDGYQTTQDLDSYLQLTRYNAMSWHNNTYDKITILNQANIVTSQINPTASYYSGADSLTQKAITLNNIQNISQSYIVFDIVVLNAMTQGDNDNIYNAFHGIQFTYTNTIVIVNYEVVDVPNLMFTILTLPFAFYSTAFNLTIFPGTPYQINFGNVILTILAAMILLYLIKKVLK